MFLLFSQDSSRYMINTNNKSKLNTKDIICYSEIHNIKNDDDIRCSDNYPTDNKLINTELHNLIMKMINMNHILRPSIEFVLTVKRNNN